MNLILISSAELGGDNVVFLQDRRSEHIVNILKCRRGDKVKIGLIDGPVGNGRILEISACKSVNEPRVALKVVLDGLPLPLPCVDLILALPRPIMLKRILGQATTMGISRLFLINAGRVEKSFFSASLLRAENYRPYLLRGLEQAMDTSVPKVFIYNRFKPFMEDTLPDIAKNCPLRLLAHPTATPLPPQADKQPSTARIILAVGPEGGWVDFEVHKFSESGFKPFSLGPRILRVDTAVVALLSRLATLRAPLF